MTRARALPPCNYQLIKLFQNVQLKNGKWQMINDLVLTLFPLSFLNSKAHPSELGRALETSLALSQLKHKPETKPNLSWYLASERLIKPRISRDSATS